jgi:predicted nucleic acid-binding protein
VRGRARVLLHASDESSPVHEPARRFVEQLAAGPEIAYLFWPTIIYRRFGRIEVSDPFA